MQRKLTRFSRRGIRVVFNLAQDFFANFALLSYIEPMVICSICLHTVPSELTECPFCESVIDGGSAEAVNKELRWEIVRTVSTEIEATLIAGRLRAYDIPAFVLSQVDSTRFFTVGALAVAKVFVPEGFLQQAQLILSQPPDSFPEDDENEPQDPFNDTNR